MSKHKSVLSSALLSLTSITTLSAQVLAQELEEVVVTARRQEESLMTVPVAISAVTAQSIEDKGLKDIYALGNFTPGVFISVSANGRVDRSAVHMTFRGLSASQRLIGQTFIDGMAYTPTTAPDVQDVARVEVLKGPQSAYFGRATFSGAINYVTKDPSDTFKGRVSLDYGSFNTHTEMLSFEGPIVADKLSFRINGKNYRTDGQYINAKQKSHLGKESTKAVTATVLFTPTDALRAKLYLNFAKDEDGAPATGALEPGSGLLSCNLGGTAGPYYCGQLPNLDALVAKVPNFLSVYDVIDQYTRDVLLDNARGYTPVVFDTHWLQHFGLKRISKTVDLSLEYKLESGWTLNSNTSYDREKSASIADFLYRDASNLANPNFGRIALVPRNVIRPTHSLSINTDWAQEFRVTSPQNERLRGTLGVNYLGSSNPPSTTIGIAINQSIRGNQSLKNRSRTPAVFGGIYYDFTDQLTLSAEARYQWDSVWQQQWTATGSTTFANPPGPQATISERFKSFSPRVTLDYKYAPGSTAYILFSRGYRPGGFNVGLLTATPFQLAQLASVGASVAYGQERLDNFELGWKATWLDGRARSTVAIYNDSWLNGQVLGEVFVQSVPGGAVSGNRLVQTLGSANIKGMEFEGEIAITEKFTLGATLNYTKPIVKKFVYIPGGREIFNRIDVSGNQLSQVPNWQASLSPSYKDHLTGDWDWYIRGDYTFRGRYFTDESNVAWTAPLHLISARAGVQNANIKVEGYVTNVTQNNTLQEALGGSCCHELIVSNGVQMAIRIGPPKKRTFGIKGSYTF